MPSREPSRRSRGARKEGGRGAPNEPPRQAPAEGGGRGGSSEPRPTKRRPSWFTRFAGTTSRAAGRPVTFALALIIIVAWGVTGPIFKFSDTWQLVINTGTTIVTFLMVFLIQNTQNRDSEAIHVKLDELIRSIEGAHNALLDLEDLDQADLDRIRANYAQLAEAARDLLQSGAKDTDVPKMDVKN